MMLRRTVAVVLDPTRIVRRESATLRNGSVAESGSVAFSYRKRGLYHPVILKFIFRKTDKVVKEIFFLNFLY